MCSTLPSRDLLTPPAQEPEGPTQTPLGSTPAPRGEGSATAPGTPQGSGPGANPDPHPLNCGWRHQELPGVTSFRHVPCPTDTRRVRPGPRCGLSRPRSARGCSPREPRSLTLVAARVPGRIAELQVDLPILAGLGAAPAVAGGPVGLQVDLRAEGVRELLRAAAALLAQEVLLPEVLTQVGIVAGESGCQREPRAQPCPRPRLTPPRPLWRPRPAPTYSSPGPRPRHRSDRSSGRGAGV